MRGVLELVRAGQEGTGVVVAFADAVNSFNFIVGSMQLQAHWIIKIEDIWSNEGKKCAARKAERL